MEHGGSRNGTEYMRVHWGRQLPFRLMSLSVPLSMIPSLLQAGPIDKSRLALMGEVGSN